MDFSPYLPLYLPSKSSILCWIRPNSWRLGSFISQLGTWFGTAQKTQWPRKETLQKYRHTFDFGFMLIFSEITDEYHHGYRTRMKDKKVSNLDLRSSEWQRWWVKDALVRFVFNILWKLCRLKWEAWSDNICACALAIRLVFSKMIYSKIHLLRRLVIGMIFLKDWLDQDQKLLACRYYKPYLCFSRISKALSTSW